MNEPVSRTPIALTEALQAQKALRDLAGLPSETFPVEAFVGMISDEVEALRKRGHDDEAIAAVIRESSGIAITGAEIAENYARPEMRHRHGE